MNFELANLQTQAALRELTRSVQAMGTGLTALQQADSDLAAAITANTTATQAVLAEIKTLVGELAESEDPAVVTVAADLETKIGTLQTNTAALAAAVAPPAPPATT
jgi:hypothetical protein